MGSKPFRIAASYLGGDDSGHSPISFESNARHLLVARAPHSLIQAIRDLRGSKHWALKVDGEDACDSLSRGRLAISTFDSRLPGEWTAEDYVRWTLRLRGLDKHEASSRSHNAVASFGLTNQPLKKAAPAVRAATQLAAAIATGADAHFLGPAIVEAPYPDAESWNQTLTASATHFTAFCNYFDFMSPFVVNAEEIILFTNGRITFRGSPAESVRMASMIEVTTTSNARAVAALARDHGLNVVRLAGNTIVFAGQNDHSSAAILRVAKDAETVVVSLCPRFG